MAYVYRIENSVTKEFYYGSRYIETDPEKDLWIKYFTSSKYVKSQIKQYGLEAFSTSIIKIDYDNDRCYWYEQGLIKDHITDPLCLNRFYRTPDQKIFCNKNRPMSDAQKIKVSQNSGVAHPVSISDIFYKSVRAAAKELGITEDTIHSRCKSKTYPDWYKIGPKKHYNDYKPKINSKQNIANKLFLEMYSSRTDFKNFRKDFISRICTLTSSTVMSAEMMYGIARKAAGNIKIPRTSTGKPVSIDGETYPSIKFAANSLNVTEETISYRVNSNKYPNWFILPS